MLHRYTPKMLARFWAKVDKSPQTRDEIIQRYSEGNISYRELAILVGLSKSQISRIIRRLQWKGIA